MGFYVRTGQTCTCESHRRPSGHHDLDSAGEDPNHRWFPPIQFGLVHPPRHVLPSPRARTRGGLIRSTLGFTTCRQSPTQGEAAFWMRTFQCQVCHRIFCCSRWQWASAWKTEVRNANESSQASAPPIMSVPVKYASVACRSEKRGTKTCAKKEVG